ncbi:MAG: hypothetical protein EXR76_06730 [Myxococcales bacterium]|nr:hypothetical protein [Myxococcales bacterium]
MFPSVLPIGLLPACGTDDKETGENEEAAAQVWRGASADHLVMGASDNAEVIKVVPGTHLALLASSKARKISLLSIEEGALKLKRERASFPEDTGEGELTHVDFFPDGKYAALTRTRPVVDGDGVSTDWQGSLVVVKVEDTDAFGEVVFELPVGPMKHAVDISPDGRWADRRLGRERRRRPSLRSGGEGRPR